MLLAAGKSNELILLKVSTAMASTTSNGLVRADIIPRMLGILGSATPSVTLAKNGKSTVITSFPPSISLSTVAVFAATVNFLIMEMEGMSMISAIMAPVCAPL